MGDVLVWYALCALVVFCFRGVRPRRQLALGLASLGLGSLISFAGGLSIPQMPEDARGRGAVRLPRKAPAAAVEIRDHKGMVRG